MELDGSIHLQQGIYEQAKLPQWSTKECDVGTYEQHIHPNQLWCLEKSPKYPGYYYIKKAFRKGYCLAKWGEDDRKVGVYNGQYYDDQLWKFQPEGNYYRICNKHYSSAKIAKWGKMMVTGEHMLVVTVHWDLPLTGSISDNESFISGYVVTFRPQVLPCDDGSCVLTPGTREFVQRELTFSMKIGQTYNVTIQTENCNNSQPGEDSNSYFITLQGGLHTLVKS